MEMKENDKEINFSEDDLKKILEDALSFSPTIEDAILEKKEADKATKETFNTMKKTCSNIMSYGNETIIKINFMILQATILKIISFVAQNGGYDFLNDVIVTMQNTKIDIKSQKVLLKEIKKAILKLEKNKAITCNVELSKLMAYIFEKEDLIIEELANQLNISRLNVNGIEYYGVNKNQEELIELNKNIDKSAKSLGLRK